MDLSERGSHEENLLALVFHVILCLINFLTLREQLELINLENSERLQTVRAIVSHLVLKYMDRTHTDEKSHDQQQIQRLNERGGKLEVKLEACGESKTCSDLMWLIHQFQDQANNCRRVIDFFFEGSWRSNRNHRGATTRKSSF